MKIHVFKVKFVNREVNQTRGNRFKLEIWGRAQREAARGVR